jgi:hypothetical protein
VDAGSREENASKMRIESVPVLILSGPVCSS